MWLWLIEKYDNNLSIMENCWYDSNEHGHLLSNTVYLDLSLASTLFMVINKAEWATSATLSVYSCHKKNDIVSTCPWKW